MGEIYCVPGAFPHLSPFQLSSTKISQCKLTSVFPINPFIFLQFPFTTSPTGVENILRLEFLYFLANGHLRSTWGALFYGVLLCHGKFSKPWFLHWSWRQRCSNLRGKPCSGDWRIPKRRGGWWFFLVCLSQRGSHMDHNPQKKSLVPADVIARIEIFLHERGLRRRIKPQSLGHTCWEVST